MARTISRLECLDRGAYGCKVTQKATATPTPPRPDITLQHNIAEMSTVSDDDFFIFLLFIHSKNIQMHHFPTSCKLKTCLFCFTNIHIALYFSKHFSKPIDASSLLKKRKT